MKKYAIVFVASLLLGFSAMVVWPQAEWTKVQGKITDNGEPVPGAQVVFTAKPTGKVSKMKTDSTGAYFGVAFPAGEYQVEVIGANGESLLNNKAQAMDGGATIVLNIDLTKDKDRGPWQMLTKEQIDAIKAHNARATAVNALIAQAWTAMNAKDWQAAIEPLQKLVAMEPARWDPYQALGTAHLQMGHYEDAVAVFEKGISNAKDALAADDPKTDPVEVKTALGQMLVNQGNASLKLHKTDLAIASYTKAAEIDPKPATAYFNLCATLYNAGEADKALGACDKAIAANPNRADAYFIKGSALYGNGKVDANNKYIVPPGTVDALKKYLELAPEGSHAGDVKAMLELLDRD